MIGICVKASDLFTLFDDYEITFHSNEITVMSDDGTDWFISYQGGGYFGCRDERGREVSFLVE